MEGETDPPSDSQLESMGFASFGQKHKRPKHQHGSGSQELAHASLPKKPPASIPPTEAGHTPMGNQAGEKGPVSPPDH